MSREHAHDWVDSHRTELSTWHRTIWDYAEPAWREYRSAAWYVDLLNAEGFTVEAGSGGMPTAFSATWSNGSGPTVLTYAEYDAVPGNCQAAVTRPETREGLSRFAPGHTDPHSALGISTLGGLLAAKHAMERDGIPGTLRYTGEPAEKMQGSKIVHGLRGYYDNVDAIISFHPFYMLPLCNTVRWDTQCGAYYSRVYTFLCDEPETWGTADPDSPIPQSHSAARAPGANAALFTMYSLTKSTQDSMLPAAGGWSLSDAILTGGQATADNLPAGLAQIQYSWRCPTVDMAESVLAVLDRNAELAAASAHCRVIPRWVSRTRPGVTNHVLADVAWRNLQAVGAPEYGPDAVEAARDIQRGLGIEPMDKPYLAECEKLIDPREAEAKLRHHMPAWQTNWTSDDYVEMTWYAPTVRLYVARPALRLPDGKAGYPGWVMNALGGIPAAIDPTIVTTAKTIAGTILDLMTDPDALAAARAEFERRTMGPHRIDPLLPADFAAPLDLRWPDYVPTKDGRDWWIPMSDEY